MPETASTRATKEPEPTPAEKKVPSPQGINISQKRGSILSLLKMFLLFILFCLSVHLRLSLSDYGITMFKTSVSSNEDVLQPHLCLSHVCIFISAVQNYLLDISSQFICNLSLCFVLA